MLKRLDNLTGGKIPTAEDYAGAAQGLIRLQRTYNLKTADLMSGNITGVLSSQPLTTQDFIHIGETAINQTEWGYGSQWLELALMGSTESQVVRKITLLMAKAYVAVSLFFMYLFFIYLL